MQVESFFPGRIRVSSECFKHPEQAAKIHSYASQLEGIKTIAINARTGSVTITYDPDLIEMSTILAARQALEKLELQFGS